MTLGQDWSKRTGTPSDADQLDIRSILGKNDEKARRYFDNIRDGEVANAVAFCIDEAKPYIVLNAPLCILDSSALSDFQAWARDQHIEARIFGINTERFHARQEDCVALALMPNV